MKAFSAPATPFPRARAQRLLAGFALLVLLCNAAPALAESKAVVLFDNPQEDTRALAAAPARFVLVKALGQGASPQEAEAAALKTARALASTHLEAFGGAQALDTAPEGQRIVNLHHFPVLGFGPARAVVLVELRLRGQAEVSPLLRATVNAGVLELSASRASEAVAALVLGKDTEPQLFPGGVGTFHLTPGKPVQQTLPHNDGQTLHVLACTGGLVVPANPATLGEAFTKAKVGRPHPAVVQGVVSECEEIRLGQVNGAVRALRQKGSETPVNMTGAAGREAGLPVGKNAP